MFPSTIMIDVKFYSNEEISSIWRKHLPVWTFHKRMEWSLPPDRMYLPLWMEVTAVTSPWWPCKVESLVIVREKEATRDLVVQRWIMESRPVVTRISWFYIITFIICQKYANEVKIGDFSFMARNVVYLAELIKTIKYLNRSMKGTRDDNGIIIQQTNRAHRSWNSTLLFITRNQSTFEQEYTPLCSNPKNTNHQLHKKTNGINLHYTAIGTRNENDHSEFYKNEIVCHQAC